MEEAPPTAERPKPVSDDMADTSPSNGRKWGDENDEMNDADVLLVRKLEKSPPVGGLDLPSEGRDCWAAAAARFASAALSVCSEGLKV